MRAILRIAASSHELLKMLIENREKALNHMGLSAEEKATLISLSVEDLTKMVRRSGSPKDMWRPFKTRLLIVAAVVLAWVLFGLMRADGSARPAKSALVQISVAESLYQYRHEVYGGMDDLVRAGLLERQWVDSRLEGNEDYEFGIALEGDSFTATARPNDEFGTLQGFRIGPEGSIRPLE